MHTRHKNQHLNIYIHWILRVQTSSKNWVPSALSNLFIEILDARYDLFEDKFVFTYGSSPYDYRLSPDSSADLSKHSHYTRNRSSPGTNILCSHVNGQLKCCFRPGHYNWRDKEWLRITKKTEITLKLFHLYQQYHPQGRRHPCALWQIYAINGKLRSGTLP